MQEDIQNSTLTKFDSRKYLRRISALFIVLVLILTAVGIRVWQSSNRFSAEDGWVDYAKDVDNATQMVLGRLSALQAAATVYGATGAPLRAAEFGLESPHLEDDLTALAALVKDNRDQVRRVNDFASAVRARRDLLAEVVSLRRQSGQLPPLPEEAPTQLRHKAAQILAANDTFLAKSRQEAGNAAR